MSRWVGSDGWEIEPIRIEGRTVLRVKHLGYLITYARSIAEAAEYVDLADLVEVRELRQRSA